MPKLERRNKLAGGTLFDKLALAEKLKDRYVVTMSADYKEAVNDTFLSITVTQFRRAANPLCAQLLKDPTNQLKVVKAGPALWDALFEVLCLPGSQDMNLAKERRIFYAELWNCHVAVVSVTSLPSYSFVLIANTGSQLQGTVLQTELDHGTQNVLDFHDATVIVQTLYEVVKNGLIMFDRESGQQPDRMLLTPADFKIVSWGMTKLDCRRETNAFSMTTVLQATVVGICLHELVAPGKAWFTKGPLEDGNYRISVDIPELTRGGMTLGHVVSEEDQLKERLKTKLAAIWPKG